MDGSWTWRNCSFRFRNVTTGMWLAHKGLSLSDTAQIPSSSRQKQGNKNMMIPGMSLYLRSKKVKLEPVSRTGVSLDVFAIPVNVYVTTIDISVIVSVITIVIYVICVIVSVITIVIYVI